MNSIISIIITIAIVLGALYSVHFLTDERHEQKTEPTSYALCADKHGKITFKGYLEPGTNMLINGDTHYIQPLGSDEHRYVRGDCIFTEHE